MNNAHYFIGLISGTSADGIDAALVQIESGKPAELKHFLTLPLPKALKETLIEINKSPTVHLAKLSELQQNLGLLFAQAAQQLLLEADIPAENITAIGSHGQTLYHAPEVSMSVQIGHPAFIAKKTGIVTVADFRVDDMANGGQGAPLAPAFHQQLWGKNSGIVLVNIGGISNISFLGKETVGFDTGPGNGLMDEFCQQHFDCHYDANGNLARQSKPDDELLKALMSETYLHKSIPKSTGRELFNNTWLSEKLGAFTHLNNLTVLSTLNQFTVETIALGLSQLPESPNKLWICGGGALNKTLINRLQAKLDYPVASSQEDKLDPNAIEAMMFAWLAEQRLSNQEIELSTITGAYKNSVLGAIWHP